MVVSYYSVRKVRGVDADGNLACAHCLTIQPYTEFRCRKESPTGRDYTCKTCKRNRQRARLAATTTPPIRPHTDEPYHPTDSRDSVRQDHYDIIMPHLHAMYQQILERFADTKMSFDVAMAVDQEIDRFEDGLRAVAATLGIPHLQPTIR